MKADVFPVTAPPELEVPPWVPGPIAHSVRAVSELAVEGAYGAAVRECGYSNDFDDYDYVSRKYLDELIRDNDVLRAGVADFVRDALAEITRRYWPLTCDRRMRGVWRELSKQRSSGEFLHPARLSSAPTAQGRQDAAMLQLFNVAFRCQHQRYKTTTTRGEIEQQRDHYLAKANELRDDIRMMLDHGNGGLSFDMKRYPALEAAARAYEDYANEIHAINLATALERRHDSRGRWVALTIADTFRTLFGKPMYGLTATITSVVLGRAIDPRTVRQWVGYPAVKPQKTSP